MKQIIAGLALASLAVPASATDAATMNFDCRQSATQPAQPPELSGSWDLVMDVGGIPSFGLLSVGRSGPAHAGSIALNAGVAVVRSLKLDGRVVAMVVVTGEGDVRFDGSLAPDGRRMCGIVTYHGGRKLEMVASKRPDRASARNAPAR